MLGGHGSRKQRGQTWRFQNWFEDAFMRPKSKARDEDESHPLLNRWAGMGGPKVFGILLVLIICAALWLASIGTEGVVVVDATVVANFTFSEEVVPPGEMDMPSSEVVVPTKKKSKSEEMEDEVIPIKKKSKSKETEDEVIPIKKKRNSKDPDDAIGRTLAKLKPAGSGQSQQGRNCSGGLLYVYDMPSKFNTDIVRKCKAGLGTFHASELYCWKLQNIAMGAKLNDGSAESADVTEELFGSCPDCWYNTQTHSVEHSYHFRMLQHPCRTDDPNEADAFYVPFYVDLALEPVRRNPDSKIRNRLGHEAIKWLKTMPYVTRNTGHDHFMVLGNEGYKFKKGMDDNHECDWLLQSLTKNFMKLTFDRDLWDSKFTSIPYPTNFHPSTDKQLRQWQEHVRSAKRRKLVSFAESNERGAAETDSLQASTFRALITKECKKWKRCSFLGCDMLNENEAIACMEPATALKEYLNADFCLQPRGDTPPRKNTFDAMVAGCIPVFFSVHSAYNMYHWFLPLEWESWSVLIDEDEVESGRLTVKEVLSRYTPQRIRAMQKVVIDKIIPRIVVANPMDYRFKKARDSVDRTVQGMMHMVARYRAGLNNDFPNQWTWGNDLERAKSVIADLYPGPTNT